MNIFISLVKFIAEVIKTERYTCWLDNAKATNLRKMSDSAQELCGGKRLVQYAKGQEWNSGMTFLFLSKARDRRYT